MRYRGSATRRRSSLDLATSRYISLYRRCTSLYLPASPTATRRRDGPAHLDQIAAVTRALGSFPVLANGNVRCAADVAPSSARHTHGFLSQELKAPWSPVSSTELNTRLYENSEPPANWGSGGQTRAQQRQRSL